MSELVRIPLADGDFLVAEIDRMDIPGDSVVLAAPEPGRAIAQSARTLESSLASLRPALAGITEALKALGPHEVQMEFGVKLGGETGVILAKGTAEVHFTVNLTWNRSGPAAEET
ncbi:CU044_2847 family protein [Streptomyces griseorubiginosus]|uniref:CU044_2847 family protein n=1 Tax=Streptomyces griseorubiginosus TaxID=67304 RepID=UPI00339DBBC6